MGEEIVEQFTKKWSQRLFEKIGDHIFSGFVAFIVGAAATVGLFFFTSHKAPIDKLKESMRVAVANTLKDKAKNPKEIDFDFVDSYKLSIASNTILMSGKFESVDVNKDYVGTKNAMFMAVFEEGAKSLLDEIVGRDAQMTLSALIFFNGEGDSRRISDLRIEDVFGKGEKAVLFDIIQEYADGSAISPVIAYKYSDGWKLTLLQSYDDEAINSFKNLVKENQIKIPKGYAGDDLRDLVGSLESREIVTFREDWMIELNGKPEKFIALRSSSGYKFFQHPEFGYKQMLIVDSYQDGGTLAAHRIFVKVFKLDFEGSRATWRADKTWNAGEPMASSIPVNFDEINFDHLYGLGINRREHVIFWNESFGKELRGKK
jgi:hypothetical protein